MSARAPLSQPANLGGTLPDQDIETRVLAKLRGHTLRVPDPLPLYASVPFRFNRHYARLGRKVDEILAGLDLNPKSLRKAKVIDVAYLTCAQFPLADWDALLVFAHYTIWIFLWDDETDQELPSRRPSGAQTGKPTPDAAAAPTIATDMNLGDAYRAQSLAYIGHQLGLHDDDDDEGCRCDCRDVLGTDAEGHLIPPTSVSGVFAFVGPQLRARCDGGEVGRFWEQIRKYMAATAVEQEMRLVGRFPSLDEFFRMRCHSVGVLVHTSLAVMRFGCAATVSMSNLDESIQEQLNIMQDRINKNLLVMNDIFSLKKELSEGTLLSLIPLAVAESEASGRQGVVAATAGVVAQFEETTRVVVKAGAAVRHEIQSRQQPPGHAESAEAYTSCLELLLHGSVNWTLKTERYGVGEFMQDDGSLAIVL